MSTVSEKRIEANRRNAQKSTGPVSNAGKAKSSRNALKHGLAAQTHTPPGPEPEEFEHELNRWNESVRPAGPAEEALVRTACHAAWKLTKIAAVEEARAGSAVASAADEHARAQADRAEEVGRRLVRDPINRCAQRPLDGKEDVVAARRVDDPPRLVRELTSFAEGVDWLLARWDELRRILHEEGFWHYPEKIRALRLLGKRPEDVLSDPTVRRVTLDCQACHPDPIDLSTEIYRCMIGTDGAPLYFVRVEHLERFLPTSPEAARADLFRVVDQEVARLEALKSERLDGLSALDAAAAESRAWIDTSADSGVLHRYETAAQRALHRSLDLLLKLRKAGGLETEGGPQKPVDEQVASAPPEPVAEPRVVEEGVGGGPEPPAPNEPKRGGSRRVVTGSRRRRDARPGAARASAGAG
ncbi:MAG: hypothetical protein U0835_17950 [Isosphaeraceae bacterium]